jgi:hypothetical protein
MALLPSASFQQAVSVFVGAESRAPEAGEERCYYCLDPMAEPTFLPGADSTETVMRRDCGHGMHWRCFAGQLEQAVRLRKVDVRCGLCNLGSWSTVRWTPTSPRDVVAYARLKAVVAATGPTTSATVPLLMSTMAETDMCTEHGFQCDNAAWLMVLSTFSGCAVHLGSDLALLDAVTLRYLASAPPGRRTMLPVVLLAIRRNVHADVLRTCALVVWRHGDTPPAPPSWQPPAPYLDEGRLSPPALAPRLATAATLWWSVAPHGVVWRDGEECAAWIVPRGAEFKFVWDDGREAPAPPDAWVTSASYPTRGAFGNNVAPPQLEADLVRLAGNRSTEIPIVGFPTPLVLGVLDSRGGVHT